MRRYYCSKLETQTDYHRKEKRIKLKHQTLINCTHQIVEQLGLADFGPNIAFYFCLFAYSCDMRKILEKSKGQMYLVDAPDADVFLINKAIQLINLIENALNRFSKKIFHRLMEIPEISYLIQHYFKHGHESYENNTEYLDCVKILDEKSRDVLSNLSDPKRAEVRAEYYISEPFFLFNSK